MTNTTPERHLRDFIDEIYGEPAGTEPAGVVGPLFVALRKQFSFSSGIFVQFDPSDWTITVPYAHDIDPDVMQAYGEHYYRLDPYRVHLANLKRPNDVVRMSDIVDVERVSRGEFGEAMRMLDYFHAIAMVPFIRGVPLGAVAVHRPRRQLDFDRSERTLFRWFVSQAARAMDYRYLASRLRQPDPATMVVDLSERRILALTEEARGILAAMPEGMTITLPCDSGRPHLFLSDGHAYALRTAELGAQSLWRLPAAVRLDFNTVPELTDRRVRMLPDGPRQRVLVVLERIEGADEAGSKLSGLGLTPRQAQVALLLVLGKGIKEIARTCGISINTAKEYVADVYRRLDVHTRGAFLATVTGAAGPGENRRPRRV